ncbi:MAG TPA: hypothetical protein DCP78_17585 [Sphingobacterium sp.]|nr:hypothetical protein [Sphingobacterium sp.]
MKPNSVDEWYKPNCRLFYSIPPYHKKWSEFLPTMIGFKPFFMGCRPSAYWLFDQLNLFK